MSHGVLNPSRDPRVEDPSNLWLIDPLARRLVPLAVRHRISANMVSVTGLFIGAAAAIADEQWRQPSWALAGLLISLAWLIADSLDGMVARATGTTSAFGRELDGLCDHGVFAALYVALAVSFNDRATWCLVLVAAAAHAVQANLYEAERERFHRRLNGSLVEPVGRASRNPGVRFYYWVATCLDWASAPFDHALAGEPVRGRMHRDYERAAVPVLRMMVPLSQNLRIIAIFIACFLGRMKSFMWYEIVPLSLLTAFGVLRHRAVEAKLLRATSSAS